MQGIKSLLFWHIQDQDMPKYNWHSVLQEAVSSQNTVVDSSTGFASYQIMQGWQGKVCDCACTPQHRSKAHTKHAAIAHLEHSYSTPRFWAKKT